MNLTKKFVVLLTAVVATAFGLAAVAKSPWQTVEFEIVIPPEYISCLGEDVAPHYWVSSRFREFETPSGNFHYIEYWTWEAVWTGQLTGSVWFDLGNSPFGNHVGKGEVLQWTSHGLARPVAGDGPKFRYNQRFKYTVNANGELEVFYEPPVALDDWIRCLGPKG